MKILVPHRGPATDIAGADSWWDKPWRTGFRKQPHGTRQKYHDFDRHFATLSEV
jgi:hypothetical protein